MFRDSRNNAARILFSPDLYGGEGGIRTPDTLSGMPVFKTGAINHSATSPVTTVFCYSAESKGRELLNHSPVATRQHTACFQFTTGVATGSVNENVEP